MSVRKHKENARGMHNHATITCIISKELLEQLATTELAALHNIQFTILAMTNLVMKTNMVSEHF